MNSNHHHTSAAGVLASHSTMPKTSSLGLIETSLSNTLPVVNHKRKWDDILCDNEKQELEQHALILASLCSKPENQGQGGLLIPNPNPNLQTSSPLPPSSSTTASLHFTPPLSDDYDEIRVSPLNNSKSDPKKRIRTTPEQLRVLEKTYERETNPSQSLREDIARKLGMTPRRVQVWFQNKRAKERRITKSMISEQPESPSHPSSSQSSSDNLTGSERHLMPIIETVPKIHSPSNSPSGSPIRHTSSPLNRSPLSHHNGGSELESPPQLGVPSLPLEPNSGAPYLPPPQVQSFSVPEGIGRNSSVVNNRRDNNNAGGRLHLPFPGERNPNPFPGPGTVSGSKEVQGDWKLPPLREIYNGI